jgi:hypothetical protein
MMAKRHSTEVVTMSLFQKAYSFRGVCGFVAVTLTVGCGGVDLDDPSEAGDGEAFEEIGTVESELTGGTRVAASCNYAQEELINDGARMGRRVAASPAFADCMYNAVTFGINVNGRQIGPYIYCNGDPHAGYAPGFQAARAIDAARMPNNVVHSCSSGSLGIAIAETSQNDGFYHTNN